MSTIVEGMVRDLNKPLTAAQTMQRKMREELAKPLSVETRMFQQMEADQERSRQLFNEVIFGPSAAELIFEGDQT